MPESVEIPAPVSTAIRRPANSATNSGDSARRAVTRSRIAPCASALVCTPTRLQCRHLWLARAVLSIPGGPTLRLVGRQWNAMDFYNSYSQGFVRVAACTHHTTIGDPAANAASVLRLARACHDDGVAVAVFPELTLSGYSIEDIVLQDLLLDDVENALLDVVAASAELLPVLVVGG